MAQRHDVYVDAIVDQMIKLFSPQPGPMLAPLHLGLAIMAAVEKPPPGPLEVEPVGSLISLKEAARQSGLSYSQLRLLARTGKIAARRLGRDWFTTPEAVAAYLKDPELRRPGPRKRSRD